MIWALSLGRLRAVTGLLAASWIVSGCAVGSGGIATSQELQGPWRPEPLVLDPATISAGQRACLARPGDVTVLAGRFVAVDARGGNRLFLLFDSDFGDFSACELRMDAAGNLSFVGSSGMGNGAPFQALAPGAVVITGSDGGRNGGADWVSVTGRVGAAVAAVRVLAPGGPTVRASVGGGWFAAWWPGSQSGFTVEAFDATGEKIGDAKQ